MAQMSPHFSVAEYWSYAVSDQGVLGAPFPPQAAFLNPDLLDGHYLYAFGETVSTPSRWELAELYRLESASVSTTPLLCPAVSSPNPNGIPTWGAPVSSIQLPQVVDGSVQNRKYWFIVTRFPLRPETVNLLVQSKPALLPTVELLPEGSHFRYVRFGAGGQIEYTTAADAAGSRVLFVVDPYSIGRHLADSLEYACNRVLKYTLPDAADTGAERIEAERRNRLAVLAQQLVALRDAGVDVNGKLRAGPGGGHLLDEFLVDMDPNAQGELGRRRRQRERYARAILAWTTTDVWERLHEDASHSPDRAQLYYAEHLRGSARCLERLPETEVGQDYLLNLYQANLPDRASRPAPTNSNEFVVQEFLFTEERLASSWEEPVATQVGRGLYTLHLETTKVLAAYAVQRLNDWSILRASAGLQTWASGPLDTAAGWTAYRWAYYLRNTFALEHVELNGVPATIAWMDVNGQQTAQVLDLSVNWDTLEWQSRLGANTPNLALLGTSLNLLGAVFSTLALTEALENRRAPGLPILRASAAYASLVGDAWVMGLFSRLNSVRGGATGLAAARWMGVIGAGLGALASLGSAVQAWTSDGEGDVALAQTASAIGGGLAVWGSLLGAGIVAGPPGWVAIALIGGGTVLMLAGGLAAAWLTDTPIENMVEHSYFGSQWGQAHDAPPVALCPGRVFAAWAGDAPAVVDAQIRAFENFTWGFRLQGGSILLENPNGSGYPLVLITPQRLTTRSYFEVEADLWWGTRAQRLQVNAHGMIRLHVGDRAAVRAENLNNAPFEAVTFPFQGSTVTVLSRGMQQGRIQLTWVIVPNAAIRAQLNGRHLTSARLSIRLHTLGDAPLQFDGQTAEQLLVPVPEPGISFMFLDYQLVHPPSNPQPLFGSLNQNPASSAEAYPP